MTECPAYNSSPGALAASWKAAVAQQFRPRWCARPLRCRPWLFRILVHARVAIFSSAVRHPCVALHTFGSSKQCLSILA